ncbi:MAG: DUF58 domain-containing protein [Chitinophagales bacterium]|nr:DUF58 domain-containing protein [Chitinophagales bacterium]MCZ2392233.1 DUF58 domain-containing protein [Chitinophagales bacterium]
MSKNKIEIKRFDKLDLLAKQVVEGFIIGLHKSPYHGFSAEFAEYRMYNAGDSVRNVDWKVYAKTGKMFIKKFDEETNLRCQLVIDISSSMYFPKNTKGQQLNKLEYAAISAASLNYMLNRQRDAVGLTLVSDRIEVHTPSKTNSAHQQLIYNHLSHLLNHQHEEKKQTNLITCIHQIAELLHQRSLVILFSDFMEEREKMNDFFDALLHLKHNKHEVVIFHTYRKKEELDFVFDNRPHEFIDLESGMSVKLMPNEVKNFYQSKISEYLKMIKHKCSQYRIDWVEMDIDAGFEEVLQTYLLKRMKMKA